MTTQHELTELAKKHLHVGEIASLLTAIEESRLEAGTALWQNSQHTQDMQMALSGDNRRAVPLDNTGMVLAAAKAQAALTCVAKHYLSLAGALQRLGEDISY